VWSNVSSTVDADTVEAVRVVRRVVRERATFPGRPRRRRRADCQPCSGQAGGKSCCAARQELPHAPPMAARIKAKTKH